jgi:hypothetical protein
MTIEQANHSPREFGHPTSFSGPERNVLRLLLLSGREASRAFSRGWVFYLHCHLVILYASYARDSVESSLQLIPRSINGY